MRPFSHFLTWGYGGPALQQAALPIAPSGERGESGASKCACPTALR